MTDDRILVLDLGGVVARWVPGQRTVELAQVADCLVPTVERLVFESGFDDAADRGRFTLAEFVDELAGLLGLPRPVSASHLFQLRRAWAFAYEISPAVLRAVSRYPGRTALFTNNGPLMDAALQPDRELASVHDTFDQVICSWRLGACKPEPEAFELAAAALDADPAQIVFFDDSEDNVQAARAAGWDAHRFTTTLDLQAIVGRLAD